MAATVLEPAPLSLVLESLCCFPNICDSDEPGLALFSHALCPLEEPSCALLTQTKFNFFFSERTLSILPCRPKLFHLSLLPSSPLAKHSSVQRTALALLGASSAVPRPQVIPVCTQCNPLIAASKHLTRGWESSSSSLCSSSFPDKGRTCPQMCSLSHCTHQMLHS